MLAEAARDRRPVALHYTSACGKRSKRTVHPYGIVAHRGRWYLTGADAASGATRTFRLDRITTAVALDGVFDVPDGFDPTDRVLYGIAQAPHQHSIALLVQGTPAQVQARFPAGLAVVDSTVHDHVDGDRVTTDDGDARDWVRVHIGAERLDWVPAVLAGLGLPFVIERPDALRSLVEALGERLLAAARAD